MPPKGHSKLSPSAARRWMHCTAAPSMEQNIPDPGSSYAEEGTLAHAIAELKLRKAMIEPMGPKKYASQLKAFQASPQYNTEMLSHADAYLDYIKGIAHSYDSKPYIAAESTVDLSTIVPECSGTADCIILWGHDLHVIDYKYGRGVQVAAEGNEQLKLYAVGAVLANSLFYDIRTVHMHIFQPRLNHIDVAVLSRDKLMDWGVFWVKPKAKIAFEGPGEYRAGDWCQFCRARGQCPAQAKQLLDGAAPYKDQDALLMSNDVYSKLLPQLPALKSWINQVEDAALHRLIAGETIPGYKLVEGRSKRDFKNQDAAFDALVAAGFDRDLLYVRTPLTLAATEKLVGKSKFCEIAGQYIVKPAGTPTLAPVSDKRPAMSLRPTPEEAFGAESNQ